MSMEDEGMGLPQRSPDRPPAVGDGTNFPEFVPMPSAKGGREFYSGLKRGVLQTLVLPCAANGFNPPVKSVTLRRPGTARGPRMIVLRGKFGKQMGLLDYMRKLRDEQTPSEKEAA